MSRFTALMGQARRRRFGWGSRSLTDVAFRSGVTSASNTTFGLPRTGWEARRCIGMNVRRSPTVV